VFLVVVVCRREESTQSLKIELLFWIGPIKTKREEERANGISSKGGSMSAFSFVNKGKKKDMVSSVYLKRSPN